MKRFSRLGGAVGWLSLLVVLWVAACGGFLRSDLAWAQKAEEILILHTNSVTGHVFGCPT